MQSALDDCRCLCVVYIRLFVWHVSTCYWVNPPNTYNLSLNLSLIWYYQSHCYLIQSVRNTMWHHTCYYCIDRKNKSGIALVILKRAGESLLPWKSNKYYVFVCVRVRAPARVRACGCLNAWACTCSFACVCSVAYPACNAYAPYCDVIFGTSGSTMFFDVIS